jgi:hypothetical protein
MSTFAFDPAGKLHIVVELCPEREEALADCVGQVAGFSVEDAPASAFVEEGKLHIVVALRPKRKAANSSGLDRSEYFLARDDSFSSVTTYTYSAKE